MDTVEVYENPAALARAAADRVVAIAADAILQEGRFSIGLSGGSTPRPLYELLARDDYVERLDWARAHVFWGDERCVPPESPDSNYGMAYEVLLAHVPIPPENIHRIQGELDPAETVAAYEDELQAYFGPAPQAEPRFNLLLQGMGADGHTASLFPRTKALDEATHWVVANFVPKLATWRITLTVPAINAAANVIFLVTGADKADTLRRVLYSASQSDELPAQLIAPEGELRWMVDEAAARYLPER